MLKGKITKNGVLQIARSDNPLKIVYCPFSELDETGTPASCGEWCPLFGEIADHGPHDKRLDLCHKTLKFTSFEDRRELDATESTER